MNRFRRALVAGTVTLTLVGCSSARDASTSTSTRPSSPTTASTAPPAAETLIAVGDIADCTTSHDSETAALVEQMPGTIALIGDTVYERGTTKEFADCYDPVWGQFNDRARPVPGNHEYNTKAATGYFRYFGERAGDPGKGYYSYDIGAWHIVAINSNCKDIGGCGAQSPQVAWLTADLAAHPNRCTLAYWHHPRWSSFLHGPTESMDAIWKVLADNRAELVLSGHDHDYERFAPMNRDGAVVDAGLRQIVVGTGGRTLYPNLTVRPGSEVRNSSTFGVLRLALTPSAYSWEFVPVRGSDFTDAGTTSCTP